jgi:hypothetical protein
MQGAANQQEKKKSARSAGYPTRKSRRSIISFGALKTPLCRYRSNLIRASCDAGCCDSAGKEKICAISGKTYPQITQIDHFI